LNPIRAARCIRNAYPSTGVYLYPVINKEKGAPIGMKFVKGIVVVAGLGCIDNKNREE